MRKLVDRDQKGKKIPFPFSYINDHKQILSYKQKTKSAEDFLSLETLLLAMQNRALQLIMTTTAEIAQSEAPKRVRDNELFYQARIDMTKAHIQYVAMAMALKKIETTVKNENGKNHLIDLVKIWALHALISWDGSACYDSGFFGPRASEHMRKAMAILVNKIRP